jgi:putative endonuclease
MSSEYFVYILTNKSHTALYVGVTNNLIRRIWQHKEKQVKGFTSQYNINILVWFEIHNEIQEAISREKQLKGGSRQKKIELIETHNPKWKDLYSEILE